MLATAGGRGRWWLAGSWLLSVTHLGLLEQRRSLGLADVLTSVRGNLPATRARDHQVVAVVALATDVLDGRIARRQATTTPFGRDADAIADAVFWTWYALRHEPNRRVRLVAVAVWGLPVVTVTAVSMARGEMVTAPRPAVVRPAVAMQIVLAVRAVRRPR